MARGFLHLLPAGASALALLAAASGSVWAADAAQLEEGKLLFQKQAQPACATCHTLKDAGASGNIGPDLDDLQPSREQILAVLRDGSGPMPSFDDSLTPEQMDAVAAYVLAATQGDQ